MLRDNVRNNAPIPPGLTHEPIVCIIDVTKVTYFLYESLSNKTIHKELNYVIYDRGVLQINAFELVEWEGFEHVTTRVPRLLRIFLVKCLSGFCR